MTTKVAVIGAGNWGKNLVRNFWAIGALHVVAEASTRIRESVACEYPDVTLYEDYRPLLDSDVPAVAIAVPAAMHYTVAKECLTSGKDVFVEKPLTLSVAEAEELTSLAGQNERILMVGHLLLYQPAIPWIKEYLDSGALGRVHTFYQERLNLGQARFVENALWSLGVHDIAVLLYLIGQVPNGVQVNGQRILQSEVEDDVNLHLEFPNAVKAHLRTSWLWPEKRRSLTVIGSEGMLVYDELNHTVTLHNRGIHSNLESWDEGSEVLFQSSQEPLLREVQHFVDCVRTRERPLSDGASGIEVVRVLERAGQLLRGVTREQLLYS